MRNEENPRLSAIEQPNAVPDGKMASVTGGVNTPELWNDGKYHVRCEFCGSWLFGKTREDCLKRLDSHSRGECTFTVL